MLTNQGPPLATLTMGSLYTISYLEYTSSKELTCLEASYTNPTVYMYYYTVYPSADQSVPSISIYKDAGSFTPPPRLENRPNNFPSPLSLFPYVFLVLAYSYQTLLAPV